MNVCIVKINLEKTNNKGDVINIENLQEIYIKTEMNIDEVRQYYYKQFAELPMLGIDVYFATTIEKLPEIKLTDKNKNKKIKKVRCLADKTITFSDDPELSLMHQGLKDAYRTYKLKDEKLRNAIARKIQKLSYVNYVYGKNITIDTTAPGARISSIELDFEKIELLDGLAQ